MVAEKRTLINTQRERERAKCACAYKSLFFSSGSSPVYEVEKNNATKMTKGSVQMNSACPYPCQSVYEHCYET
jgi:hypothetical protein